LTFTPRLASKADLSDGGLRPNRKYRVVLDGFPRSSGLRSIHGRVLTATRRSSFTTARQYEAFFTDNTPTRGPVIRPDADLHRVVTGFGLEQAVVLDPMGKLSLLADEPIRPDTVSSENLAGAETAASSGFELDAVRARIEIDVKAALDPDSLAILRLSDRIADLGGHGLEGPFSRSLYLVTESSSPSASPTIVEDFLYAKDQLQEEPSGVQAATAAWAGNGRLAVSFPAIAASPTEGSRVATGEGLPLEIHATRLTIPSASTTVIAAGAYWTSQMGLSVHGELDVKGDVDDGAPSVKAGFAGPQALVLAAGGDLVVTGSIRSRGPIVLAAGGAVRLAKSARIAAARLLVVSPSAPELSGDLPVERQVARTPLADALLVKLDEPLTFRATSPWYRTSVPLVKFGPAQWFGDAGIGRVRLQFRSARSLVSNPSELDTSTLTPWMDRSEELPTSDRIQFRVELELPAGPKERPARLPFLDRVTIPARRS
jgi:hypothetical protein